MKKKSRTQSQKEQILSLLMQGLVLTPMDIINRIGCTKLASRISDLILKDGHTEICKKMVTVKDRFGEEVDVMSYWIEPKDRVKPATV